MIPQDPSPSAPSRAGQALSWLLQVSAAVVMGQTLYFKLTGAPESVEIFRTLGVEPWGRFLTATLELVAVGLLLLPRTAALGGLLGVGLMVGAVGAHLTRLGIEVQEDGGLLFGLALFVLVASAGVLWLRRRQLLRLVRSR